MPDKLLEEIKKLKAIADTGLIYSVNPYDKERYKELQEISFRLLNIISSHSIEDIKVSFPLSKDYPTAKVDIRGLLLSADQKILMVKESADQKWSLPGGWADVGYSPKEVITKEFKEETGLEVTPKKLLAVFDKKMHPHPAQPFYIYKMVFYCEAVTAAIEKGFDVLDVQFFAIDNLPELSEDRIMKHQIEMLYQKIINNDRDTYFD